MAQNQPKEVSEVEVGLQKMLYLINVFHDCISEIDSAPHKQDNSNSGISPNQKSDARECREYAENNTRW